tara:strand:- start:1595 stop:3145 length:1551 start_codon:yes stop_codon:yes gene_type:complete
VNLKFGFISDKLIFILSFLIIIFFFNKSINVFSHVYDGGHHGSIFLNGLEILNGKVPYKEIFLQYGYLNALINSISIHLFNHDIIAIYFNTAFFYFLSIFFLALTSKSFTNIYGYIITLTILLFNHPLPEYPWPNYSAFFFLVLSFYIFRIDNNKSLFFSGFLMALSCLSRENFYYFIIPSLIIFNMLIYFYIRDKQKIIFLSLGFILPVCFFFIYLIINGIFFDWFSFQKLPYLYLDRYDAGFIELFIKFILFFFTDVIFNIINEPQYLVIFIILLFNVFILIEELFKKKQPNIKVLFISIICLSSSIVSLNYELFRLYTSISIGLPLILYRLNLSKVDDKNILFLFILLFVSLYSIFYFPSGNVNFFKKINFENSFSSKNIKYFKNQKWDNSKWDFVNKIKDIDTKIKNNCDIEFVLNLTPDAFVLVISNLKRIQLSHLFNEHLGRDFAILLQKDFQEKVSNEILNNNIYIYSMENNIDILKSNLENYVIIDTFNVKGLKGSNVRVYAPNNCSL